MELVAVDSFPGFLTSRGLLTTRAPAFSLAALLSDTLNLKIVFALIWILTGLFLLFFGLASLYWCTSFRLGSKPESGPLPRRILGSGIGGVIVGFLAGSTVTNVLVAIVGTRKGSNLTPGGLFAAWFITGLISALVAGHFVFVSRVMLGLLGAVNLVLLLTALGGIHTIVVRGVLLIVFSLLLTTPLLVPPYTRWLRMKRWLLNLNTSLVGTMTFLDGMALFCPPQDTSNSWIDLWTILFAPDDGPSSAPILQQWGTSAFKGYIAGNVLLVIIGTAFEAYFHANAGENVAEEWNEYLGIYTGQLEKDIEGEERYTSRPATQYGVRAGMFEEPESFFSRLKTGFSSKRSTPAAYGGYAEGRRSSGAAQPMYTERQRSERSYRRSAGRPARYSPQGDEDVDEAEFATLKGSHQSDGEETDVDSDVEESCSKDNRKGDNMKTAVVNKSSAGLPRLPSYRTDAGQSQTSSLLSGSTAVDKGKPLDEKKSEKKSEPATTKSGASPTKAQVTATPSLLNAIDRIQKAQQEAMEWKAAHKKSEGD